MLILLLAYFLFQSQYADAGQGLMSIELRAVSTSGDQDSRRTIWSIVRSCLSTIFLCTWGALHPDIAFRPDEPEAGWRERWIWDPLHHFWSYKLPLFMWALFLPEYILACSVRQFVEAGKIRKKVPGWTRTHGFFMLMGGYHLFRLPAHTPVGYIYPGALGFVTPLGYFSREYETPVCPLQIDDIPVAILQIISPTETELKDKGKSDGLSKLVVLVQTLWFVIQCITRGKQHLPLTELEVVTLAYTILNFFIYLFWWSKPQNVGCPIRVYKTPTAEHKHGGEEADAWEDGVFGIPWKIVIYFIGERDNHVDHPPEFSFPMIWRSHFDDATGFWALVGMQILATVFGGIHFIAWYSEFPSRAELILWRATCILLTAIPLIPWIILILAYVLQSCYIDGEFAIYRLLSFFLSLYIASRATTLLIAFITLRSLPDAALVDVDWTKVIPHI